MQLDASLLVEIEGIADIQVPISKPPPAAHEASPDRKVESSSEGIIQAEHHILYLTSLISGILFTRDQHLSLLALMLLALMKDGQQHLYSSKWSVEISPPRLTLSGISRYDQQSV